MVETVRAMFPDIPTAAIQADLQRTGSVETTVDNALRDGGLPMPVSTTPSQTNSPSPSPSNASTSSRKSAQHDNLLQRYKISPDQDGTVEPPKVWEADPQKRQDALQKRKAFMVMQARQKLLEKQQQKDQPQPVLESPAVKPFEDLSVEELNTLTPEQRREHMLQAYEKKVSQP
ncbi:hypothetical protein DM01DRAFT_1333024 [Hesseltinella vesiculosa]|uniref:CUE domain-containing protein n=1 Tax=Hesseltinella vesiculosa TaxID=101127 RepID=A0A1X2GR60_9FUNG|nr:hypothetical protein DM01DRAFT_1333024 [Hesseltinella vesiculosa]